MPALVILYSIWGLLVISTRSSADPYIFIVISYQCPTQCLLVDPYKTDELVSGNRSVYQTVTFYLIV